MVSKKHVFWQALLVALVIFVLGLLLGLFVEQYRVNNIEGLLQNSQIDVLDSQLMGNVNANFNIGCNESKQKLVSLADRIYHEAQLLEAYEGSSQLSDTLIAVHKRYDLLRLMLWLQADDLKNKCNGDLHTVVYFYKYAKPISVETQSEQSAFSNYLSDLKNKYGNKFILIPIAGDLNLSSVDLAQENFNITKYPAVVVDNKEVIYGIDNLSKINSIIS